jgi:hypothetical protein
MLGQYALALARRRLAVFPCVPRGKEPATDHGFYDATTDSSLIESWWRRDPAFNIGIRTGARSRIFVVDVDGPDGEAELKRLETQYGTLPTTVESITPRPGRHLYFLWSDKHPVPNTTAKIAPKIDTRGEGGYVLAPPSVHPSGRPYAWSVDSAGTFAAAPQWLFDRINGNGTGNGTGNGATPASVWRERARNGAVEGQRNDMLVRLTGHLLRRQVDSIVVLELLLAWNVARCRPPLDDAEVERIVDSICGLELKRRGIR